MSLNMSLNMSEYECAANPVWNLFLRVVNNCMTIIKMAGSLWTF